MSMNDTIQSSLIDANKSTIIVENLFQRVALGCFLSSLSIFTVCGNILVLYAIQTEKNLRTVSNLFILSLALADLSVGLFVMPLSAANIIAGRWPFSSVICKMWLSIDYVASTASIFNLVLLSLDRYWAVVYPLRYLQKRTRRRATLFILLVWFISSLWAPAVIFWSKILPQYSDVIKSNECDTAFRSNKTFKTLTALVNFYVPLLTMITVSCRIMVAIRSRSKMEFGRRLSSTTQQKMKRNRIHKPSSLSSDNQVNFKPNSTNKKALSPVMSSDTFNVLNSDHPTVSNNTVANNTERMIEPGQCFCSTCQRSNENDNDSIWEAQPISPEDSDSPTYKRFSFAQINHLSKIFSPKKQTKENKDRKSFDLTRLQPNNNIPIKHSASTSDSTKYSMLIYAHRNPRKYLSPITKKPSLKRSTSTASSFSDENSETTFSNSVDNQRKSKPQEVINTQNPTLPDDLQKLNSSPQTITTPTQGNEPTMTLVNDSSTSSPIDNTMKMNFSFFTTLINPSRSHALQKELKAARQLGMLVGVFTVSWLPYFLLFLVVAWCNDCVPESIFTASIWLGYLNSTFNPLIYPLCNAHFRRAFQKICYCKHEKAKLPNLGALRELQALHSVTRRRRR